MQRDYPRVQLAKEVRPGDFKDALWTAYMNCINALKVPQSSSVSDHGTSYFVSAPSWEAFQSQVSILYSLCLGYGLLDEKFGENYIEWTSEKYHNSEETAMFAALTDLLKRKVFMERMEVPHAKIP